ncbi:ribosomal protein L11 methyltransferase [Pustulibacterium marinum]|uniref:Ribosomal protein L11 methyltransferase n=1 Tax=Pustulibacterium marinum TaxID=1224947 RepID=A0A1I7FE79_9FLAO|nr:50S ribosomal protein L11 methyltransferase [Pustulibacterium marinum]SFU34479.1 ribosomal protein L11 methyltransferase [Pustulibacterium marinum]
MINAYIGYHFTVEPKEPAVEILIAELSELGFESFVETDKGLSAYIQKEFWQDAILADVFVLNSNEFQITYEVEEVEQVNWNEEWEKNFHPINVDEKCTVRAPFHEKTNAEFEIVIEPKMSFGTGHHETTHMMIQHLLQMELSGKKVLDMGCGTGVLAILAAMKGAKPVDAIDIDNWCYLNSIENCERNNVAFIDVFEGDVSLLSNRKQTYDVIIANINRNILLADIPLYTKCLNTGGVLLLSGFYQEDLPIITEKCNENALKFVENIEKNNWVAAKYVI